jgi:hypothetical protein
MDIDKIINSVFAQTKTKITADDPLFAIVVLNEAVLTEFLAHATEEIQVAANEIELQTGAHIAAAKELDNRLLEIRCNGSRLKSVGLAFNAILGSN